MKKRMRLLVAAAIVLGMCPMGAAVSWGEEPDRAAVDTAVTTKDGGTSPASGKAAAGATAKTAEADKAGTPEKLTLEGVEVRGEKPGYRVDTVKNAGPLGEMKLEDMPYSVSVMTGELIENLQASMPDTVLKINPFVQISQPQARGSQSFYMMRGFRVDNFQALENGMLLGNSLMNMEDKERVEVLTGLSGFLYGPASPGGTINYVLKSPTPYRLTSITTGVYGGTSAFVHGDFGGPIYKDKVTYRLNVVGQDGNTAIDHQSVERYLATAAVDWRIADKVLLQFDASHHNYKINGLVPVWTFSTGVPFPSAPDQEKLWAQKYGFTKEERDKVGARLTWDLSDRFTMRAGYGYEWLTREAVQFSNTVSSSNGRYTETMLAWAPWKYEIQAGYYAVDGKFDTGPVAHKMTGGFYGRRIDLREYQDASASIALSGNFGFSDPVYVGEPSYSVGARELKDSSLTKNLNYFIGDSIVFSKAWSALVGASHAQIVTRNYNVTTGAVRASYNKSEIVPTLSLIYKPVPMLSTYATYTQGLEKGGTAGSTTANSGEIMPPMVSNQYEIGAKATVGNTLLTMALFQIDKAFEYTDATDNIYKQDGRETHRGLEFSATGKVTGNLTIFGGFTLMQARVDKNKSNTALEGKRPANVAQQMAKVYAEYDIDRVPGLTLTGGAYYYGKQAADAFNTTYLPSVITGDIGARYQLKAWKDYPTTLRLNVTNVTNEDYWVNSSYTGDPRTIMFSVQVKF